MKRGAASREKGEMEGKGTGFNNGVLHPREPTKLKALLRIAAQHPPRCIDLIAQLNEME